MAKYVDRPRLLPDATLDRFKYEVGQEVGIPPQAWQYGGDLPARYWGAVGGRIGGPMVRVMVRFAEEALADGTPPH